MLTLLDCFDQAFGDLKFDAKFAKRVYLYRVGIVTRSREHMEFFGSNLLGTHRIWFKDQYVTEFFEKTIDITYDEVEVNVRKATTINHTFKVSGDIMNLTIMYLMHRFLTETSLTEKQRHNAAYDLAMVFFYRCLCILISDQFTFTADPKVAQQAYANLSMKFLIKKLGTWNKVIDYQAKALVDKANSIHWRYIHDFYPDERIVYAINDSQNRIKSIIKEYYGALADVAAGGESVGISKSLVIDAEGDESLREKRPGAEVYCIYMRSILMDKFTFIHDDLVDLVSRTNSNTSKKSVMETLLWMSTNAQDAKIYARVNRFIELTMVLCVYFMDTQIDPKRYSDYPFVTKTLKDLFLATRTQDEDLLALREVGEKIVEDALTTVDSRGRRSKISDSLSMATRTACILYICLRALKGAKT